MTIVACDRPSASARMTPTWAKPWSSDCRPVSTRSTPSSFSAAASALPTTDASARASASPSTWMARSAPRASASRSAWVTRAGPAETDDHFAALLLLEAQRLFERVGVRLVQLEAGVPIADPRPRLVDAHRRASRVTTCLRQTAIFMAPEVGAPACTRSASARTQPRPDRGASVLNRLACRIDLEQRGVGAAEPERVRERVGDVGLARHLRHVVEIAVDVRVVEVDGGRQELMMDGEDRDAGLEPARGAEQVPGHRLGRRDRHLVGVIAEDALDGQRLGRDRCIPSRCRAR